MTRFRPLDRRLTAILAIDVVGYSALMADNEAATLAALAALRSDVFGPVFADHAGQIVKSMGDGWLVAFASASAAVNAAMQVQDRTAERDTLRLRMGVHIGDVTRSEADLHGDGINIAARLEGIAPTGGLVISDAVYQGLDGTLSPSFQSLGPQGLKNIARPVSAWLRGDGGVATQAEPARGGTPRLVVQITQPRDPRADVQDLSDAIGAEVHTVLSGVDWLTTRISGTPQPGAYTLDLHLRARGERLRLAARLTDPAGEIVWSEKSDGMLADSFDWQDEAVDAVVFVVADLVLEAETRRLTRIPQNERLPEQDMLLGMMAWRSFSIDSFVASTAHHVRAFTADPSLAAAYGEAIMIICAARTMGENKGIAAYLEELPRWVEMARPMAPGDAVLSLSIGIADYLRDQRLAPLHDCVTRVLRLAPFDARLLSFCGWAFLWAGRQTEALECFEKSIRRGRLGPYVVAAYGGAATTCVQLGDDAGALRWCAAGLAQADTYPTLYSTKAAALALSGRQDEAEVALAKYRALMPDRTIAAWQRVNDYGRTEGGARYFDGLRRAGLPEA